MSRAWIKEGEKSFLAQPAIPDRAVDGNESPRKVTEVTEWFASEFVG